MATPRRNARLRRQLFTAGTQALHGTGCGSNREYECPLCRQRFSAAQVDDLLSVDHVPPRVLVGPSINVLICRECNSSAGSGLDHEMASGEDMLDVQQGTMPKSRRLVLEVGDQRVKADVSAAPDGIRQARILADNPRALAAVQALGRLADAGKVGRDNTMYIAGTYHPRKATLGWLRCAYLAAFAVFGYTYIRLGEVERLRAEIADGLIRVPTPHAVIPSADRAARRVLVIDEPEWLRECLAIQLGRHIVLMPGSNYSGDFAQLFVQHGGQTSSLRLAGKSEWPWPNRPQYILDHQLARYSGP